MEPFEIEPRYEVGWEGCDLVVNTVVSFLIESVGGRDDPNWKSLELVVEDRLCEEEGGFARFSAVNYRFSETMLLDDEDALLRNP